MGQTYVHLMENLFILNRSIGNFFSSNILTRLLSDLNLAKNPIIKKIIKRDY